MRQQVCALIGFIACVTIGGALTNACSAAGDGDPGGNGGSGAGAGNGTSAGSNTGGSATISSGAGFDGGDTTATSSGTGGSCASVSSEAESQIQPADIIIAVDTSGSMDEESAEVQANLNNFASIILASNIDVHVILIADASVCIPAMLGSGSCPGDENLPIYQHVVQTVNSNDALQVILSTYPQWQGSLRPEATKTFLVVSDDESDLGAAAFTSQLLALDPPTFDGFKFDAIVSFDDPQTCLFACFPACGGCGACCPGCMPLAAAEGAVYKQLVQQTMGVSGDLCAQDFDGVFTDMATAVVQGSGISCEYDIPAVPGGDPFDPTKVNVEYTPGGTMTPQSIGYVPGGAPECGMQNGGWYYDDPQNPTKIIMCDSTCTALQGDATGKVDVLFGCDTVVAVPD